jgi:hypothetical protein
VTRQIAEHIETYQNDRASNERQKAVVRELAPWWRRASARLDELQSELKANPLHSRSDKFSEELNTEIQIFDRAVEGLRSWMAWAYDPQRPRHRPVDWPRGDLEMHIAFSLADCGIATTRYKDGDCAFVLRQVYEIIGITSEPESAIESLCELYGSEIAKRLQHTEKLSSLRSDITH